MASTDSEAKLEDLIVKLPASHSLEPGDRVVVDKDKVGQILWVGTDRLLGVGKHYGVRLQQKRGTCDGSFRGKRFFHSPPGYGLIIRRIRIKNLYKGEDFDFFEDLEPAEDSSEETTVSLADGSSVGGELAEERTKKGGTLLQKLKDATKRKVGKKKSSKKKSAAMAVILSVRKVREIRVAERDVEKEHIYLMCAYWFRLEAGVSGVEAANQIPADIVTLVRKFLHKTILGRPSVELKQAFEDGHADVPRILHAQGVDIVKAKAPCCKNCSALDYACKMGHWEVIEVLMSAGADPRECERSDGFSPLLLALGGGHKEITKKLIDYGCDINAQSKDGTSALHLACYKNFKDIAQLLVDGGADIEAKASPLELSPFLGACVNGHMEMADFMLSVGADINAVSGQAGLTALMIAAFRGNVPLLKWLMDRGCDITIKSREGLDAFYGAGIMGHLEACRFVIEHCGDVELRREGGLKLAVDMEKLEATEVFLAVGADANAVFDDGETILMVAAESGNLEIVQLLLKNGANVLTTDDEDDDALAYATKKGEYEVADFLQMEKAKALSTKEAGE